MDEHEMFCKEADERATKAEAQVDEAVKTAKQVKRMLLEHGYHPQSAVMYELDKITIMRMDVCASDEMDSAAATNNDLH